MSTIRPISSSTYLVTFTLLPFAPFAINLDEIRITYFCLQKDFVIYIYLIENHSYTGTLIDIAAFGRCIGSYTCLSSMFCSNLYKSDIRPISSSTCLVAFAFLPIVPHTIYLETKRIWIVFIYSKHFQFIHLVYKMLTLFGIPGHLSSQCCLASRASHSSPPFWAFLTIFLIFMPRPISLLPSHIKFPHSVFLFPSRRTPENVWSCSSHEPHSQSTETVSYW